ncbi:MAG: hypothetical protein LBC31_03485 [Treponema sp.]|jgi:hypothetical protein|nr:hypothetical protein [Treponema sp.]
MSITRVNQRPYISDNILYIRDYSLNPQGVQRIAAYANARQIIDLGKGRAASVPGGSTGTVEISTISPGSLVFAGAGVEEKAELPEWGTVSVVSVAQGDYSVTVTYADGRRDARKITLTGAGEITLDFDYRPGTRRNDTDFTLDGRRGWALGAGYSENFFQLAKIGFDLRYTFLERYGGYGSRFILPNAFFVSFRYGQNTLDLLEGNDFSTFSGSLGALWKIRLGETQRLLVNGGLSADLMYGALDYRFTDGGPKEAAESFLEPLAGIHAGVSYRFTPALSVDLNLGYHIAVLGDYPLRGGSSHNFSSFQANLGISYRSSY